MSLVRCLSLRSVLNARRYRSSYACLVPLNYRRDEEEEEATRQFPETRSYHSFIHHQSSSFSRNRSSFQSPAIPSHRTISTFNFTGSTATVEILTDWVLKSAVSNVCALHNVADALASLQHLLALLSAFTFSQWWVCIIVTSLLIRGVTIPVLIDWLNNIAEYFKNVGSHYASPQGEALNKASLLRKSGRLMYTMLEKEFLGVKGSISGKGIQVPLFWLSIEELRQNMAGILVSCLRGKTFSAELIRNGVLSEGRLVIVVGDGFGLEIQIFDLDFSLILRRRQVQKQAQQYHQYLLE
ncbi:LOW QUALITY PROTEIN: mitochondrial inner membrane protein OXA1 [Brassica napus]|uniref:LOW QUALITY PROTEIN: mitochondrial inner membrane protein OXA1 n=1 Tax=Brassica oleracea var. oleracea TaxID=109376 RepID=UPI0006A72320|nr:PREDICTED: LOW QUALITY PROTEIN: mitochondrial inner membrane protein OXA1 [Brassica oleracea var. oleracea]XP_013668646.1 LOW QUALITY PROTEIN: mitochondrial inner membrane protein OXA1 [Brassica napus]